VVGPAEARRLGVTATLIILGIRDMAIMRVTATVRVVGTKTPAITVREFGGG